MRNWKVLALVLVSSLAAPATAAASGSSVLTATSTGGTYAPTFTGNGLLGVRVPPAGQGFAPGKVAALSELAGFYAIPTGPISTAALQTVTGSTKQPDPVQQRANIPTWSTLTFRHLGGPTSTPTVSAFRQSIDLHTGIITTALTVNGPEGATDLTYQVLTDRARPNVGLVSLAVTPHWSGLARVTDEIDGTPAILSTEVGRGSVASARRDWVTIKADGTNILATLASQLAASTNVVPFTGSEPVDTVAPPTGPQTISHTLDFSVSAGQTYTFTKYVGVVDSQATGDTVAAAQGDAAGAAAAGWNALLAENATAWAALWKNRIDILGDSSLATIVNASEFYLWSSTRAGVDWSISPAGLSSNGYDGHIFWDAETWMYPSLLAEHPDLAAGMNNYRFDRLGAARQHATATGSRGARFPWESALDGTEQIPPPVSVNSEGLYEQHITADIALAQWQYYLDTGNRSWLRTRGWPVIDGAAQFWASRVKRGRNGSYHIDGVTGPDEENPNVSDEVYTNVAAARTISFAIDAAQVLHRSVPRTWRAISTRLLIAVNRRLNTNPEFSGYRGQLVKQADVTLIQYPWAWPETPARAQSNINFYVPRTDPTGPSMSDAVNEIDSSSLGTPGCSASVFTERSWQPFMKDPFDQFSETRTGGAFTFMTGIGGFLQEFLYGYSGMRFGSSAVTLDPSLNAQLPGIVLRGVNWHGRRFTVQVGQRRTVLSLTSGAPLPVLTPTGLRRVRRGHHLVLATRRPDRQPTSDRVRCGAASATSAQAGTPALAAVDGSPATDWEAAGLPATLTLPVHAGARGLTRITLLWGRLWPPAPGPNIPPPPGPVQTLRPTAYLVQASRNGSSWRTVARVAKTAGTTDRLHIAPIRARFIRIEIAGGLAPGVGSYATSSSSSSSTPSPPPEPMLEEVTAR